LRHILSDADETTGLLATHLRHVGFPLELQCFPDQFHLGKLIRNVGSIVKNEIAPLSILDIRLNLCDTLGTIPQWVLDVSHRLDDRFPITNARSPNIRAAIASGRPELMMLLVPLTLLMRSLLDVDTRERHITMRTVNFGVARLQLIYRASDEAREFKYSDKASAGAVVHVHRRDTLLKLMMV
jgi:hypothetical protein